MKTNVFMEQLLTKHGQYGDLYGHYDVLKQQAALIKNGSLENRQASELKVRHVKDNFEL